MLVDECKRIMQPGGWRIVSEGEPGSTTAQNPATMQALNWVGRAMWMRGFSFCDGKSSSIGTTMMLRKVFQDGGFEAVQLYAHLNDSSWGAPHYQAWLYHLRVTVQAFEPLITRFETKEKFDTVLEGMLTEARNEEFRVLCPLVTAVG